VTDETPEGTTTEPKRSLFQLLGDVPRLVTELVRAELDALKAELKRAAIRAGLGAGLFAVAAIILLLMLVVLVIAGIAGLALVVPTWAAALIVAGGLLLIAAALGLAGVLALRGAKPDTRRTIDSVAEDLRAFAPGSHAEEGRD